MDNLLKNYNLFFFAGNVFGRLWLEQSYCKLFTGFFIFCFAVPVNIHFYVFLGRQHLRI